MLQWKPEREHVEVEEVVEWMPNCTEPCPSAEGNFDSSDWFRLGPSPVFAAACKTTPFNWFAELSTWMTEGKRKETIDDETTFCSRETLSAIIKCKNVFDSLEPQVRAHLNG